MRYLSSWEENLEKMLIEEYGGKKVSGRVWISEKELLYDSFENDEGIDVGVSQLISVSTDDDNLIDEIIISTHTSCWGDSGLGEEFPEDHFDWDEYEKAAFDFVDSIIDKES